LPLREFGSFFRLMFGVEALLNLTLDLGISLRVGRLFLAGA
jgi:hypothetical protein